MELKVEIKISDEERPELERVLILHAAGNVETSMSFTFLKGTQYDKFPMTWKAEDNEDGKIYEREVTLEDYILAMNDARCLGKPLPNLLKAFGLITANQLDEVDLDSLDYDAISQWLLLGDVIYG